MFVVKLVPGYFSEIVYLRGFAILAVISIHVSATFTQMNSINFLTFLYMSVDTFSHFAVPLFVCISGFVLYNKYRGTFSLSQFYKKRFASVLPQYTLVTLLIILVTYGWYVYFRKVWNIEFVKIIYAYISGDWASFSPALVPLWFFVLIIQLYLVYPIIEKIFTKCVENYKSREFLIFLLIVQIVFPFIPLKNVFFIGNVTLFVGYLFYFVLGMYVRSNYQQFQELIFTQNQFYILFFALLSATIIGIGSYNKEYFGYVLIPQLLQIYPSLSAIITPFFYMLIFLVCLYIVQKIHEKNSNHFNRYLKIIGNYSFGIYLAHILILYVLTLKVFPKIGLNMNNWLYYPIVFTLVLFLSVGTVFIINKIPYHEYIIGTSR